VIARTLKHSATPQVVHAAVANVRPPCRPLLHDTDCAGRARALLERKVHAETHHVLMRTTQRHVEKAQRIEERMRCVPERFQNGLLRDLCRAGALGVATHAIDDKQQSSVLSDCRDDPVLVFFASPYERDISVLDPQEGTRHLIRLAALYITREQINVSRSRTFRVRGTRTERPR
jgi:hypothetical protein